MARYEFVAFEEAQAFAAVDGSPISRLDNRWVVDVPEAEEEMIGELVTEPSDPFETKDHP